MVTPPLDPDDDFPFDGGFPQAARPRPGEPGPGTRGPASSEGARPAEAARSPRTATDEDDFDPEDPEDPEDDWDDEAPGARARPGPGRAGPAGESDEGSPGPDWDRVREAAWRVRQRARRHERVLHTRISRELARDLRRAADDLRVPVSNLVRNVLEEAFGAVERVSDEVGGFLEGVLSETDSARDDVRRLRRGLHRLARRGRRSARRFGDAAAASDEDVDPASAFAVRGDEPAPPGPPAPSAAGGRDVDGFADPGEHRPDEPGGDRVSTTLRERGVFRPRGADLPFPEVLGWQPLLLNATAPCACGERTLAAGEEAFVAVTERGLSRAFLCRTCMRARGGA